MTKHIGRILISTELLSELLQFPGATFVAVRMDSMTNCLEAVLEHPAMPEIDIYDGQTIPVVVPYYRMVYYPDGSPKGIIRDEI